MALRMALLSKSGPFEVRAAGALPLGFLARYSGVLSSIKFLNEQCSESNHFYVQG